MVIQSVARSIAVWIRTIVSGDKRRFRDDNHDLDLTYITDRIMGMAIPATGVSSLWRNPAPELAAFLNEYHPGSYRIFNLSTLPYDYSLFEPGSVVDMGFPDHHNPPILLLHSICQAVHAFLSSSPRNVVLIHCLAGRGRTGTVIASYMTYAGDFDSGSEALEHFAQRRSVVNRGVSQPSQRRYVQYYSELLSGRVPFLQPVRFKSLQLFTLPDVGEEALNPQLDVLTAPTHEEPVLLFRTDTSDNVLRCGTAEMTLNFPLPAVTDIYIRCYHVKANGERKYLFRAGFNTGFTPSGVLRLTKKELDDAIKSKKFDPDFFIDLVFEKLDDGQTGERENPFEKITRVRQPVAARKQSQSYV